MQKHPGFGTHPPPTWQNSLSQHSRCGKSNPSSDFGARRAAVAQASARSGAARCCSGCCCPPPPSAAERKWCRRSGSATSSARKPTAMRLRTELRRRRCGSSRPLATGLGMWRDGESRARTAYPSGSRTPGGLLPPAFLPNGADRGSVQAPSSQRRGGHLSSGSALRLCGRRSDPCSGAALFVVSLAPWIRRRRRGIRPLRAPAPPWDSVTRPTCSSTGRSCPSSSWLLQRHCRLYSSSFSFA